MGIAIPNAVVLPGYVVPANCVHSIRENSTQVARINYMACCTQISKLCVAQGADKTFDLQDASSADYSNLTEAKFRILSAKGGTTLLEKTYTGGDITLLNDYTLRVPITDTESAALTEGTKYWGLFVEITGGERLRPGEGQFIVEKTEGYS